MPFESQAVHNDKEQSKDEIISVDDRDPAWRNYLQKGKALNVSYFVTIKCLIEGKTESELLKAVHMDSKDRGSFFAYSDTGLFLIYPIEL
jgi:hypothetical protein